MIIKFEKIKKEAKIVFTRKIINGQGTAWATAMIAAIGDGTFNWRKSLDELEVQGIALIDKWDIRCVNQLIAAFPEVLPKKYRTMTPVCYINEEEEWVLEYN